MKIVLAIAYRGRNIAFVTDKLETLPLKKAIVYTEKGRLEFVHVVKNSKLGKKYLRSNPNNMIKDNLDSLSVSLYKLMIAKDDIRTILNEPGFQIYRKLHQSYIDTLRKRGDIIIAVDGQLWTPQQWVIDEISQHKLRIQKAAKKFSIDPNLLGAIIIDEHIRYSVIDFFGDLPGAIVGRNTSVGIAQIKIDTARDVIRKGYYNPDPSDSKLKSDKISKTSNAYLCKYLQNPTHNINLAAGRIQQIIDHWSGTADLHKRPEIIATLYSKGLGNPNKNPVSSNRGKQIVSEFYLLSKKILKP